MEKHVGRETRRWRLTSVEKHVAGEPRRYITRGNINNRGDGNNESFLICLLLYYIRYQPHLMHNITRRATEFVNPFLAFQQVGKFWSFPVTNIPFLWQLLMRDTSWRARNSNEEKSD